MPPWPPPGAGRDACAGAKRLWRPRISWWSRRSRSGARERSRDTIAADRAGANQERPALAVLTSGVRAGPAAAEEPRVWAASTDSRSSPAGPREQGRARAEEIMIRAGRGQTERPKLVIDRSVIGPSTVWSRTGGSAPAIRSSSTSTSALQDHGLEPLLARAYLPRPRSGRCAVTRWPSRRRSLTSIRPVAVFREPSSTRRAARSGPRPGAARRESVASRLGVKLLRAFRARTPRCQRAPDLRRGACDPR